MDKERWYCKPTWIFSISDVFDTLQHVFELAWPRQVKSLDDAGVQLAISGRLLCKLEIFGVGGQDIIASQC